MKRSTFTKLCTFPLVFLLTFTILFPLFLPSTLSALNRASSTTHLRGKVVTGPIVPQPANPEYLIISKNDTWVQDFADWKTKKGVPTQVANITLINITFPIGPSIRDLSEQIWNYIHWVYTQPGAVLQWVLLIGDNSTLPPRYIYLPDTYEWTNLSATLKPTDFYYSVMHDNDWDDDNDGVWGECTTHNLGGVIGTDEISDWAPDLYVGRIPLSDELMIRTILQRAISYERYPTGYATTGWDRFLLAGAISNYDEEVNAWNDNNDYTDEAELSDWLDDNIIPGTYTTARLYESRYLFWDYTPTNTYVPLNNTAVGQYLNYFSPALINIAGHGSPIDIQRKYDDDQLFPWSSSYPYGRRFNLVPLLIGNITGVAIGDADHDGIDNEIVYTHGFSPAAGNVVMLNGSRFQTGILIDSLFPDFPTCVDIGDFWNNGSQCVAVGTLLGFTYVYYFHRPSQAWTRHQVHAYPSPVLCIEFGNADNVLDEITDTPGVNVDLAWGHRSGSIFAATGTPAGTSNVWPVGSHAPAAIYSIDVGDPDDDALGEITVGTGYTNILGNLDGDVHLWTYTPPNWGFVTVNWGLGGQVRGLDVGDAENDGSNEIAIGCSDGAIYTFESQVFPDPPQQVEASGNIQGVYCLRIDYVDQNRYPHGGTPPLNSIIVGTGDPSIRKYHTNSTHGFIDYYNVSIPSLLSDNVSALDTGELSYYYGEMTSNDINIDREIAAGTMHAGQLDWYEWDWFVWSTFIDSVQAISEQSNVPPLIYTDSCLTGAFDYYQGSLATSFLMSQAIGYVGSMRVCWYQRGPMANSYAWGLSRNQSYMFWDLFFSGRTHYRPGETLYDSKALYNATLWPWYQANPSYMSWWQTYDRKNLLSYALFGDPEVDIFTANPAPMTVSHPTTTTPGSVVIHVETTGGVAIPGALVCLQTSSGTHTYQVGLTDASGNVTFSISISAITTVDVTVTKHNYSPYEGSITFAQQLTVSGITVNHDNALRLLDITGVTAQCPTHNILTDTSATRHTYSIFLGTTNITYGDLSWDTSTNSWQILDISTATFADGDYFVRCYFEDVDGIGWSDSTIFTITTVTSPPPNILEWLINNWWLIALVLVILLLLVIIIVLIRRRKKEPEPKAS